MAASHERKEAEAAAAAVTDVATPKKEKKDKKEKKEKKDKDEKKDRKEKKRRSETDGVHKESKASDKKEKKHKKEKLVQALDAHLQASAAAAEAAAATSDDSAMADAPAAASAVLAKRPKVARAPRPIVRGALVEFARPLAEDKYQKKVLKMVKLAAKHQALLRGVKEVNKALRKAPAKNPSVPGSASAGNATAVPGVVVVAGDVNPAEVVMHLPLACEDVNAPYVFVASRGELGQAARTKRPTSVVMLKAEGRTKKGGAADAKKDKPATVAEESDDDDDEAGSSYPDLYREFVKTVQKEYAKQMKGII